MKNSEFKAIEKRLVAYLPGFSVKGQLMCLVPLGSVLRGFCFEPSGSAKDAFYLWIFFQPLFVPAKEINLTFGYRLEDSRRWRNNEPDLESTLLRSMKAEVVKLLKLHNAATVARALEAFTKPNSNGYVNPNCREAFAYALAQAGEVEKAIQVLETLTNSIDTTIDWQSEIALRVSRIRELFLSRPEDAIDQLKSWEYETVQNLGLERFLQEQE